MSTVIRFHPGLREWLDDNLNRGQTPAELIHTMVAQKIELAVAQTIVAAFLNARRRNKPSPHDHVPLCEDGSDYYDEPATLPNRLPLLISSGSIRIAARADHPPLALLSQVLSPDECAELIEMARTRLRPSTVVDPISGRDVVAAQRSSHGMFFRPRENALVSSLDRRFSEIMNLPEENGEGIQVLRYQVGALSAPHYDFLSPSNADNVASIARSGQRVSTLVVYLNEVERGGETTFPEMGWTVSAHQGDAVYFEYCNSLGQVDRRSLHASAPVLAGEKWVATKWMRQRRFVAAG